MIGSGREDKKDNDLFYTCSLIDYISRKTKNIASSSRKRWTNYFRVFRY